MLSIGRVVGACEPEEALEVVASSVEFCDPLVVSATVEVCGTVVESTLVVVCRLPLVTSTGTVSCPEVEAERVVSDSVVCFTVDGSDSVVMEACELDCRKVVVPSSVEVSPTVTFSVELCDLLDVPATVVVCRSVVESMWLVVCILLLLSTAEVVSCPMMEVEVVVCSIVDGRELVVVEACELVCETVVVPCCVEVSITVVVAGTVLVSAVILVADLLVVGSCEAVSA